MHLFSKAGLFALVLLYTVSFSEKLNLAINDLDPQGIEASTSAILSDRIRAELINSNKFRVMERSEMQNILKEQGFQQSGACNDNACIVEIGQLLGVKAMLAGTIGKIENLYTVSVRMINIQTGEIEFVINENCECPVKSLLNEMMPAIAKKMIARIELQKKKEKQGATGYLALTVKPAKALLVVNGDTVQSKKALEIPAGAVKISALFKNYSPFDTSITLAAEEKATLNIALKKTPEFEAELKSNKKRNLWIIRGIAGALAVGSAAFGVVVNGQANKAYDDYKALTTPGDHSAEYKAVTDKENFRNILLGAAGGITAAGLITFAF
ncbi:MAG: hypothetical protein JNL74_21235 [Fibrobacteres bacterium]|nr:hypothetical protein [Fibrobacterota bacterium]